MTDQPQIVERTRNGSSDLALAAAESEREKIERLARYISRPPIATERLSLTDTGHVR